MVKQPIIIIGAGGHGRVVLDALLATGVKVLAFSDSRDDLQGTTIQGVQVISDDMMLARFAVGTVALANGIGMVGVTQVRREVFDRFHELHYEFVTVLHPSAVVASDVTLARGVQGMAGCIVQTGTTIGENTIVNTKASIDHDCRIGAHVHIAPGATLSGGVAVGDGAFIGAGATICQGVVIGSRATIGAGAVVLRDVSGGTRVVGVPAKDKP